eukprot:CAMPEP_0203719034 /NCGR_PEP_ID=MMETSP0092-20131115/3165_1 /ASSEMBLY_ACC=CAM_ASM_001090 /TAXON_ID=426623 /ORGANISM="Chaetoceros affinis, Strain CCMP159" /LENGTH=98 /DNA_ID=CAMNT_0050598321 /DNA_START=281 /DNA_END=577 /DNA_ORIENTATION=+
MTLAKIGKIQVLYMEFDPLDGLTISALNNATSAFVHFHFEVGFFERCSTSSDALNWNRDRDRTYQRGVLYLITVWILHLQSFVNVFTIAIIPPTCRNI